MSAFNARVFGGYSRYYDLLYREKDYPGEARFVSQSIHRFAPHARSVLDLGCGTGLHAISLAEEGYSVLGLDRSEQMLENARFRKSRLANEVSSRLEFLPGDIRELRLKRRFDVAVALFHVMSYQALNSDIQSVLSGVREHLHPHGLFLFDCWYGPAVLSDRPAPRLKRLEDDVVSVMRFATPTLHANEDVVDVNYQMIIFDKTSLRCEEIRETHRMRYFFKPELEQFLNVEGFSIVDFSEWTTGRCPDIHSWNVLFTARLNGGADE